ncbi:MAG: S-layer homology domain-containing protein [Candidatus Gracilibacteria bacterium]
MRKNYHTPWYIRFVVSFLLLTIFAGFLPTVQIADALSLVGRAGTVLRDNPGGGLGEIRDFEQDDTLYGLVAILVDAQTWSAYSSGSGFFSFLGNTKISEKIETYAQDVQLAMPYTKTIIVRVAGDEGTVDVQKLLEKLYFEGDTNDSAQTKLSGVVIVGDVPVPVVNKNGNRFLSMLPYTDFEEPSYVLDDTSQDFIPNANAQNLQAEVWHGLIVPPLDGQEGIDLIASYFEKNHAFHSGDSEYTSFDKKAFVGDFVTEESTVNSVSYGSYKRFTGLWEDLVYYRYTNALVSELYADMQTSVSSGDGLDNDGDGFFDEEASNGVDDDSDGLVDEDLGDGFNGIDNDGDGLTDEDNSGDNNNDAGWSLAMYGDAGSMLFADKMVDEDAPGDLNGDGCPGVCGVDDNGDSIDHDEDGYPTGWEIIVGSDWMDEKVPYETVNSYVCTWYGECFEKATRATEFLANMFVDQFYNADYRNATCYATDGSYHAEWDDDEDGFCDEDGSTEMQVWLSPLGIRATGTCAYNDADCDGLIDEDPIGIMAQDMFANLPDIQAKTVVEGIISRYVELFDKPQGVWNRLVNETGRYVTQEVTGEDTVENDYDSAISLIAKKDEVTLQYLKVVNDYFEGRLNTIVKDNLAEEIPIIGMMEITGDYTTYDTEDGVRVENDPEDLCRNVSVGLSADLDTDLCVEFVNHSYSGYPTSILDVMIPPEDPSDPLDPDVAFPEEVYVYGQHWGGIDDPAQCTIFAGSDEDGGQLVQFNKMYSTKQKDLSTSEVQDYKNCIPEFASYQEDIPEVCAPVLATEDVRVIGGALDAHEVFPADPDKDTSGWEVGPEACFEFREWTTFGAYSYSVGSFNNWLSSYIRKNREEIGTSADSSYADFLAEVAGQREEYSPSSFVLRKNFSELDILASDDDRKYTVTNLLDDYGLHNLSNDDIDTFLALADSQIRVKNPSHGEGMGDVSKVDVRLDRYYLHEDSSAEASVYTTDINEAKKISSFYQNTQPKDAVLNAQIKTAVSANLPINETRSVSFIDSAKISQKLRYVNVFDASTFADITDQLSTLSSALAGVAGGEAFASDVPGFIDAFNIYQLEDALAWYRMSIDEKHEYILTHYLGDEEAISSKARDGYEMVSLIANGDATNMSFGFNGDTPLTEEDIEWNDPSGEFEEEETDDGEGSASDMEPVVLSEWITAIKEWLEEVKKSLSSLDTYEGGETCGYSGDFDSGADGDNNGVPDTSEATASLALTSEDNSTLQSGGAGYFVVSVSSNNADGSLNVYDSYTEVALEITSGENSVSVSGPSSMQVFGGVAVFTLLSAEAGDFTVEAVPVNRSDVYKSNPLSGLVASKIVKVTTYTTADQINDSSDAQTGNKIEIYDADGIVVAVLDPLTGKLILRGADARLAPATTSLPTRILVEGPDGTVFGTIFMIPTEKDVSIGDGEAGVFVQEIGEDSLVVTAENGVVLQDAGIDIGIVTKIGQIALSDGYSLAFDNPGEINVYDPLHVVDGAGETIFTVTIKSVFTSGSIVAPTGAYEGYDAVSFSPLEWISGLFKIARAESVIADTDEDGLDDLEEWTIGTDISKADTDGDSYTDGTEIFSGFDPLVSGEKLFNDIGPEHSAYHDLAVLYLRGVVKGYEDGSFKPDNPITREEFVKIDLGSICKQCDHYSADYESTLLGEYNKNPFPDADINPNLLACIAEAKIDGIVSGYAGGEETGYFIPKKYISRAEATKVLVETAGFSVATSADYINWYDSYVSTANANKLFPEGALLTDEWLNESITRAEFVMMAVNLVEAKDCREVDTDEDLLSDTEETAIYGTDPNLADSDAGGVNDFDEVMRGSDPLDASDDFPIDEVVSGADFSDFGDLDLESGLYAVSDTADYEEIAISGGASIDSVNTFTDEVPADGESSLFVRAEIRDQDDKIYVEDSSSVIEFVLSSPEFGEVGRKRVQVKNGIAETVFASSQIAGEVNVSALITDGSLPSEDSVIKVYPGATASLKINADSSALPAGGEGITDARVRLLDAFSNLASNDFYSVTLSTDENLTLLDLSDEDASTDGLQVTTPDGYLDFRVLSGLSAGIGTIDAYLTENPEIKASFQIEMFEDMTIQVIPQKDFLLAGGTTGEVLSLSVIDPNVGSVIERYQGEANLSLSDPAFGSFENESVSFVNGQAQVNLLPGTLAGTGFIMAGSPGLSPGSAPFILKPSQAYELRIRQVENASILEADEMEKFVVEAYDEYGNFAKTDSSTTGTIRFTDATKDFGILSTGTFVLNQGSARFTVKTKNISGKINLVASASGLISGTWGGYIEYVVSGSDFAQMSPQMLYASLLGASFGDFTQENYIGGWMTFNGKTQAVTSLVSDPAPKKRLVTMDANGSIDLFEDSLLTLSVSSAGSSLPTVIRWRSFPDDILLGEAFFVLPDGNNSVSAELLSADSTYSISQNEDGGFVLKDDLASAVKIRKDGQVLVVDPSFSLGVNGAANGLSFVVLKNTEQVLKISYNSAWNKDVTLLESDFDLSDFKTLSAGIYIRPQADTLHRFVSMPSGNSSNDAMGLGLIDPNEPLSNEMLPSMGYSSIESSGIDGTIGWENENKHLLLFSSGNSVGNSNLFYTSEIGVVLGDPSIALTSANEINELGYSTDVGKQVYANQDELLTLLANDYNGDGQKDVLAVYEDGQIDVLENLKSPNRLNNRGTILSVENGISSIDTGDFNGDGLDDLFIVTKEACYAEEMCSYVFENIGGGFVAKNAPLDIESMPKQVEVFDLNNDDYDDLAIVDENMVLYTVWNNHGTLEDATKIKDFGLKIDSSENLFGDTILHYLGVSDGSVSLPIETTDFTESSDVIDEDLQAFIDSLGVDNDFTLQVNGVSDGEAVSRKVNTDFAYSDSSDTSTNFAVTKTMVDVDSGSAQVGDTITNTIQIKNISPRTLSDVYVSDSLGDYFTFDSDSLACMDCGAGNSEAGKLPGDISHPFIYGPLSLSPEESVTLTYVSTVRTLPAVSVMLGQDFYSDYKDDNYADMAISLDGNSSGQVMLYYSDGYSTGGSDSAIPLFGDSYKKISYQERSYTSLEREEDSADSSLNPFSDADGDSIPDFVEGMDPDKGIPVSYTGYDPIKELLGANDDNGDGYYSADEMFVSANDSDGDGLNDTVDTWNSGNDLMLDPSLVLDAGASADVAPDEVTLSSEDATDATLELDLKISLLEEEIKGLTNEVEKIVSVLTCNGGCLAFPGSIAFFAPGLFHDPVFGTPLAFDFGTPVFGFLAYPPLIASMCFLKGCYGSNIFRFYLSPTTTLGLGMSVCFGPWMGGDCISISVPVMQALGVCDAINGFVTNALSKASAFATSTDSTSAMNVDNSSQTSGGSGGLGSAVFSAYVPQVAINTNIQVPGFPSIFTEWWKAQKIEFFKMLDLPDVTFIYPDPKSFTTEFTGIGQKALDNQNGNVIDLDQKTKIEVLKSGILGLEDFLNMANAFPLIDIKTESVYIRYPNLTKEEIELVQKDWEAWVNDTKEGWKRFKAEFDLRTNVTDAQKEVVREMESAVNTGILAIEANLAVLEGYKKIPEKILMIRNIEAYFAKSIICYLDAILGYSAGYLLENANRAKAWAQWAVDLKKIVDGWQILIDLAGDFMDSCDKCTNQRWSGLQFLFNLLIFIPDFPVIELPKLPDIIIDVSSIQAGVDIVWPDIHFVPERIDIPKIPRLIFPSGDINLDFNFDLNIPTLPEFNFDFALPELPPLSLPNLPSLPPPPSIPEIDPQIKASLNIASSVLKIICIIRQGFWPTPEIMLKSKIEDLTERSSGAIMAFDTALTVEWPALNYDFLKSIKISTYLNLATDFSGIFDFVKNIGDQTNQFSADFVEDINQPMILLQQAILRAINTFDINLDVDAGVDMDVNEMEVTGEGEAEVTGEGVSDDEAYNYYDAKKYLDMPIVSQNLITFRDTLKSLQNGIDAWADTLPSEVRLTATNQVLASDDPLLNRYDEIKSNPSSYDSEFLAKIQDTPLASVFKMRNSLISYTDTLDAGTEKMGSMDSESFLSYLSNEDAHADYLLAGNETEDEFSRSFNWDPQEFVDSMDTLNEEPILASESGSVLDDLSLGTSAQAFNTGLYLYNSELGISTRLTAYTAESDEKTSIIFIDLDGDSDEDIVYSMGGDIYSKENHTNEPSLSYVSSDPGFYELAEIAPPHGNVKDLKAGHNDYESSSFSFSAPPTSVGYELSLYDSLDAQNADPRNNVKRLLLLNEEEGASTLPNAKESRVYANRVSGDAKLKNAYVRTLVTASGEMSTSDPITLQTIEDTVLIISVDSVDTEFELPAYTLLSLGQETNRVVRIDSGSAYLIDLSGKIDEQNLETGMEIFANEFVEVSGLLGSAEIKTSEGAIIDLDKNELFVFDKLINPENPSSSVDVENGAYYTVARAIYSDGTIGTLSDNILLNPQVCADDSAPFPVVSDREIDLAIFSTTTISAENSFDGESEIVDAYWDLDASVDADGDGIFNNDDEVIGLNATVGPYTSTDPKTVTLYISDSAGNTASAEVTVNIFVPGISIASATTSSVSGTTDPSSPVFPFHLVREREGAQMEIGAGYTTDENGNFEITLSDSDLIAVYDANGNKIAEFNPTTRQVMVYDEAYDVEAFASSYDWPSRLTVYEKSSGTSMANFVFVADSDGSVEELSQSLGTYDLSLHNDVTVYLQNRDGYEFTDSGLFAKDNFGSIEFMVGNNGNISIFNDRYTIKKRVASSLDEYLIIEIYDNGVFDGEIWPGSQQTVTIDTTDDIGFPASPTVAHESLGADMHLYFEDLSADDALYTKIAEMVERGILEGYLVDGKRYFKPDNKINRAEFAKIVLGILCIVPSDEAYLSPNVFNDILDIEAWYYPHTKEAFIQSLITGYLGEIDVNGMAPFKPNNTITRAEATKIMLEALNSEGIIKLPDDLSGEPWYVPYMEVAKDLSPYMTGETTAGIENYILTEEEALDPTHTVTRYEFVEMSVRVLNAYNCFDLDSDGDGLINYDEEVKYGTDAYNPDTDAGGVPDGTEVLRGSDPLYAEDDFEDTSTVLSSGIYALRDACSSCPCPSNIDFLKDLLQGDTVFAIIKNELDEVLGISNKVEITTP